MKNMTDAAVVAALAKLDPHSVYLPPVELTESETELAGNFEGIGITFNVPNDTAIVLNPLPGGPSEKAGLLQGDRIVKVDDRVVAGVKMPQDSMIGLMKGFFEYIYGVCKSTKNADEKVKDKELCELIQKFKRATNKRIDNEVALTNEEFAEYVKKYNNASVFEYIAEKYPELNEEEAIKVYCKENFVDKYQERINNGEDEAVVKQDALKELKALILLTKNDDEKIKLLEVIKQSGNAFIIPTCDTLIEDIEDGKKKDKVREILLGTNFYNKDTHGKKDHTGVALDQTLLRVTILGNTDPKTVFEILNELNDEAMDFIINNQEQLELINSKNIDDLTPEEKELLDKLNAYLGMKSDTVLAVQNHEEISKEEKDEYTTNSIKEYAELGYEEELTENIAKTVAEKEEIFENINIEEFSAKLDKLTEGKFSVIYKQAKEEFVQNKAQETVEENNKRETETQKTSNEKNTTTTTNNNIGFNTTKKPENKEKIESLKDLMFGNNKNKDKFVVITNNKEKTNEVLVNKDDINSYIAKEGPVNGVIKYIEENGILGFIEALDRKNTVDITLVKKVFETQGAQKQSKVLKASSSEAFDVLFNWARTDAIEKLRDVKLLSFDLTKKKDEKIAELDKKKNNEAV